MTPLQPPRPRPRVSNPPGDNHPAAEDAVWVVALTVALADFTLYVASGGAVSDSRPALRREWTRRRGRCIGDSDPGRSARFAPAIEKRLRG